MKCSFLKVLLSSVFLLNFTSAFSQEVEWKHYEYPDINLQFDLPADFEFGYPENGTLSFVGKNSLITFMFFRVDKAIISDEQRREELHSPLAKRWMEEIDKYLPEKEHLRILDVGCGAGFFSILLAKRGHQVTGIDLTPDMILHARLLLRGFRERLMVEDILSQGYL